MAGFALKVTCKTGQHVIRNLSPQSTVAELKEKLSNVSEVPVGRLQVLTGFPPKTLDLSESNSTLNSIGLVSGDTLIVEQKSEVNSSSFHRSHVLESEQQLSCAGILIKQVVPADNSCLFTSIGFVLNGKVDTTVAPYMRQIIAETVSRDSEHYCEALLGKPNDEYCKWILKPDSWGGAIELSILSHHYGIEMAVVDTLNAIINRFGEDQKYGHRVLLLFDGIHYDPLFLEPLEGGNIQTIFPTDDDNILKEAEQLALEAKSSRQFTDMNKFTLKCMVCGVFLTGQLQAQQHAKSTGHANFGEI